MTPRAVFATLLLWLLAASTMFDFASANDCITLDGNCLNNAHISTTCAGGDARDGFGCPEGSTCCLPLGALCEDRSGECQPSCRGGKLMDPDLPCEGGLSCCIPRLSLANVKSTPPRSDPKHIEESHRTGFSVFAENFSVATLMEQDVPLAIVLTICTFFLFGVLGWAVAFRRNN